MVIFHSRATYALQKAYLTFQIFRRKKMYVSNLLVEFALVAIIVVNLITKNYYLVAAAGILVLVNALVFFLMIRKIFRINLYQKDFSKVDLLEVSINYQKMSAKNTKTNEVVDVPLEKLLEICELEYYVFFYINDSQAIVLDKMDVSEGNLDTFLQNLAQERPEVKIRTFYKK